MTSIVLRPRRGQVGQPPPQPNTDRRRDHRRFAARWARRALDDLRTGIVWLDDVDRAQLLDLVAERIERMKRVTL